MKKIVFLLLMILFILFCFLLGFQKQQKLPPQEKHEVEVSLILVDVIVSKEGKFVTDLTVDDFELYEDGKKVPVNSFDLISFGERETETQEEKPEEAPLGIPKKQLIVVFDGVSSWQRNLKEGARKIVDELVALAKLGNDVMVIQLSENRGMEVLQPFTTEEELIRKALIRASGNIWFDDSIDAIKMWEEVGMEDVEEMSKIDTYAEKLQPVLEQEYFYKEKERFEKALGGIFAVANMIRDLPGRKSILIISDGFPDLSSEDRRIKGGQVRIFDPLNILDKKNNMNGDEVIRELIRFANAQNISIYTLDPDTFTKYFFTAPSVYGPLKDVRDTLRSLEDSRLIKNTHPPGYRDRDKIARIQNLRWLSDDTGAVSLRGAKKYDLFRQVVKTDLNYYYQLSYYPPRKKPDNNYHKIKVKVKRRGVDVRFRKGYTDYSDKEQEKMLLVSAFYTPSLFKNLPFEAEFVPFQKKSKKFQLWMNIALPMKKLFLERSIAYGPKQFRLHVWIKEKEGGEWAFGLQIPISFTIDSSFMKFIKTSDFLVYNFPGPEIEFSQKGYQAIFALHDDQTDEIGTWESSFSLPDSKKNKYGAIINCVLGVSVMNPERGREPFSFTRDGSLIYSDKKFYPAVTNRFQRMQDVSVFLQIYLPQGKIEIHPKFAASREGGDSQPLSAEMGAESWDKKTKVWSAIFNLDLRSVIFGEYILEVEVPVSEEGPLLSKEVRLTKLRY